MERGRFAAATTTHTRTTVIDKTFIRAVCGNEELVAQAVAAAQAVEAAAALPPPQSFAPEHPAAADKYPASPFRAPAIAGGSGLWSAGYARRPGVGRVAPSSPEGAEVAGREIRDIISSSRQSSPEYLAMESDEDHHLYDSIMTPFTFSRIGMTPSKPWAPSVLSTPARTPQRRIALDSPSLIIGGLPIPKSPVMVATTIMGTPPCRADNPLINDVNFLAPLDAEDVEYTGTELGLFKLSPR